MAGFDYSHRHPDGVLGPPSLLTVGFRERSPRRPVSLELCMFNSVTYPRIPEMCVREINV